MQVWVWAHGRVAGIGMLAIAVRAQDGRVAQPSEHLLTHGYVWGGRAPLLAASQLGDG